MENIQEEEIKEVVPSTTEKTEVKPEVEQDPLKTELEKVKKGGRTKKEKLLYTKKRIEEQLREADKEAGIEPTPEVDDDNEPVTVGMLKKMQAETATKTALQLADDIENETEKELVKYHINNTIRSTGNPKEDLKLARAIVNQAKNSQIIEEKFRKPKAKANVSSGGGEPQKEEEEELTPEEIAFMKPPFNLTKEQIKSKRPKFDK